MFKFGVSALIAAIVAAGDSEEFAGTDYLSLSRADKQTKIWDAVTADTKTGSWHLAQALIVSQDPVFDTPGDQLACPWTGCRPKTIHANGNVAKIEWVSTGRHPYTGMFKGSDAGFARLSVAKPVDTKTPNMAPGMGIKLLRDGMDSANFVCMFGVDGQDDLNFFANDFVNHIPNPQSISLVPLEVRFATATNYIQTVGLSEMASYTQDGQKESSVNFPWSLRFVPSGQYSFPSTVADGYTNFLDDLATITSGSVLYDVYATDKPTELGGTEMKIAQIKTVSEMTTSNWGDEKMYIRHQRMDDDLKIHPEWEPYTPKFKSLLNLDQVGGPNCPFAHLLQYLQ